MLQKKNLWWLLAFAVFAIFPEVVTNPAYQSMMVFTLIYMACATSWNMFSGYSGYISLGAAVFFGTGAYTMTLVSLHAHMAPGAALFWLVPLGGIVATLLAIPVGWAALRVRRHTFVVITIATVFIFQSAAFNFAFTGGSSGQAPPFIMWDASYYNVPFYYVALGIVLFATLLSAGIRRSRFGLQLLAIRDDEDRALGLGVKVAAVKRTGFAMSAFTLGMAGALYALFVGSIFPDTAFAPLFDITVALMAFLGGLGTLAGPLLGGLILEFSQQYITVSFSNGLNLIFFGALFLIVIMLMPQGIVVFIRDRVSRKADRERAAVEENERVVTQGASS